MKIGLKKSGASSASLLRSIFANRKLLLRAVLSLAGLMALAVLFLGVAAYGAYVSKKGQFSYTKPVMLKVGDLDFSFLSDFSRGEYTEFEGLELEIRPKHLDQLQSLRDRILQEGVIDDAIFKEEIPARLFYQGLTHDVRIELADMMALHFNDPGQWPLQVEAVKNSTVADMKRFDLLPPLSGGYMSDWLAHEILKSRGIKSLGGDFLKISINGKPIGLYYMQERYHKDLIASQRFGKGILFRMEEDMVVDKEDELMANSETKGHLLVLKRMWTDLKAGLLTPDKFFDLEKMGRLFAIADLMNHKYPLLRENLSFYFNPETGKVEPVAREFNNINNSRHRTFTSILQQPSPDNEWHNTLAQDPFVRMIAGEPGFQSAYLQEAELLTRDDFLEQLLMRNGEKVNVLLNRTYKRWPAHDLPAVALAGNQRNLRFVLFPDEGEITAYFNKAEDGHLHVSLLNQQDIPLEVAYLGWRDTVFFQPPEPILLPGRKEGEAEQPRAYQFRIPHDVAWPGDYLPELKVYFSMPGLMERRTALVFPWAYEGRRARNGNPIVREANYQSFDFIEEAPETNAIIIPKGNWTLGRDLVIPAGRRFEVEAGARIDLVNHAKVICYSPVYFMGTEQDSILMLSSDTTSEGMIVIRGGARSSVEYTTFLNLNRPTEYGWALTGAVIFYETPVDFNGVAFIGNQDGDDFLNVIRADFTMEKSLFRDINADAFDCDFCTGSVANSSFINVGNDGIDVSGSEITVSHVYMSGIGDKGLSSGEGSSMTASFVEIHKSEIALTSKDRSKLIVSDSKVSNSRVGLTTFMKKPEFGPGFASLERVVIEGAERPYLIEANSGVTIDGQPFAPNFEDVKGILYGAEYGKASVR
ncbi:MAG: CotH kinase family protein [Phaeodactylibacter sp.]|nr:CotH kinase family protein [Phaeodactylibacter sp.]